MKLFDKVKCHGFLQKAKDGIMISHAPNSDSWIAITVDGEEIKDLSSCEGDYVEKTYFKIKKRNFSGVIVGFKDVVTKGIIGTDWDDNPYCEHGYCFKQATETIKCAVVYYANNKKHIVPIDLIELEAKK